MDIKQVVPGSEQALLQGNCITNKTSVSQKCHEKYKV